MTAGHVIPQHDIVRADSRLRTFKADNQVICVTFNENECSVHFVL